MTRGETLAPFRLFSIIIVVRLRAMSDSEYVVPRTRKSPKKRKTTTPLSPERPVKKRMKNAKSAPDEIIKCLKVINLPKTDPNYRNAVPNIQIVKIHCF